MSKARTRARAIHASERLKEMKSRALKALLIVLTTLGFLLLLRGTVYAQDANHGTVAGATTPGIDADSIQLQQAQRQADDVVNSAQFALTDAKNALTACATQESMTLANVKGQEAQNIAGAAGQIGASTIGELVKDTFDSNDTTAANAQRTLKRAIGDRTQLYEENQDLFSLTNKPGIKDQLLSIPDTGKINQYCLGKTEGSTQHITTDDKNKVTGSDYSDCKGDVRQLVANANRINSDIISSDSDIVTAGQTNKLVKPAVNTFVGAVGAGASLYAGHIGTEASKKGASLTRDMCEKQAKNQVDQAQTAFENAKVKRDQDLMNLKFQQAFNKNLAANTSPTAGITGPGVPIAAGGLTRAPAAPKGPAAAGAGGSVGGGGGGGAGGATSPPWTFGNGQEENVGGYGMPQQPSQAQFASDGGGGGGGGGGAGGFGTDQGFDNKTLSAAGGLQATAEGGLSELALGDGGLNVMMSRARRRYGTHASDLVRSIDLRELAKKTQSMPRGPASALKDKL